MIIFDQLHGGKNPDQVWVKHEWLNFPIKGRKKKRSVREKYVSQISDAFDFDWLEYITIYTSPVYFH